MDRSLKRKGVVAAAESGSEEDADSDYVESDSEEEVGASSDDNTQHGFRPSKSRQQKRGRSNEGTANGSGRKTENSHREKDQTVTSRFDGENDGIAIPKASPLRELKIHFASEDIDDVYLRQMLEQWGSVPLAKEKIDNALAVATELYKDFPKVTLSYLLRAIAETNGTLGAAHTAVSADVLTPKVGDLISQSWGDESNPFWRVGKVLHRRKGKGDWFKVEFESEEEEETGERIHDSEDGSSEVLEVQLPLLQKGVTWNLMS